LFLLLPSSFFVWHLKNIKRRWHLLSHENIAETKAVETSLCFTKIAGKVNQWRKNSTLLRFLLLWSSQVCRGAV
jgi:hypothetical protein